MYQGISEIDGCQCEVEAMSDVAAGQPDMVVTGC